MKNTMHRSIFFVTCNLFLILTAAAHCPRLTVILIIDQFPCYILEHMRPNLTGGLKHLINQGVYFSNAFMPHGLPSTSTGHAALNTGTFAKDHGIVANSWYDNTGKQIASDVDFSQNAVVFGAPKGSVGNSPHHLMVDGISDIVSMYSPTGAKNKVFSLSLKSHPAVMAAGHLGKALWFDDQQGKFTSSRAYFDKLPEWLNQFNASYEIPKQVTWQPLHNPSSCFYQGLCSSSRLDDLSMFNGPIDSYSTKNGVTSYRNYAKTPHATNLLFKAARACIKHELSCNKDEKLVLWISISSTDFIGHEIGTQSLAYLDLIYHIDCQLKKFMHFITRRVKISDVLWILTSDHGSEPISEVLKKEGYSPTRRIHAKELEETLMGSIQQHDNNSKLSITMSMPNVYISGASQHIKNNLMYTRIQEALQSTPGIKRVWTYGELKESFFEPNTIEYNLQQQLYPGRSGALIFQVDPYCVVTKYATGTTHESPYNDDTHVPLVFYQKGCVERKIINETVLMLQVAPTIAHLLQVPKPSACMFSMLPGIVGHEILT